MQTQSCSRADVRRLLRQYQRIKGQKLALKMRRERIVSELNRSASGGNGDKLRKIDVLMERSEEDIVASVLQILEVVETLPAGSRERDIIERRYLDGLSWTAIARMLHISRSQAAEAEKRGVDALLQKPVVVEAVQRSRI